MGEQYGCFRHFFRANRSENLLERRLISLANSYSSFNSLSDNNFSLNAASEIRVQKF